MSTRRVTSYDVAARAGVSQSAVSRAFTEDGSVSRKMRERNECPEPRLETLRVDIVRLLRSALRPLVPQAEDKEIRLVMPAEDRSARGVPVCSA